MKCEHSENQSVRTSCASLTDGAGGHRKRMHTLNLARHGRKRRELSVHVAVWFVLSRSVAGQMNGFAVSQVPTKKKKR